MEELKRMEVGEFVRRLKHDIEDVDDSKFVFFIGAGCSVSSGIPCAKDLANIWLRRLKKLRKGNDDNLEEWAKQEFSNYTLESAANHYGRIIEDLFLRPEARQREIEQLTEGKDPGFGYAVLAKLMSHEKYGGHCNAALTVNFDDMIADALYLYTHKKPLVIVHDSLVGFVRSSRKRPLVLKLHGDARLEPKNTGSETSELADNVKVVLKKFLSETGLIFIGYGGHDESIANILNELPREARPWGVFWINKDVPDGNIGKWIRERKAVWVDHTDFDELMLLIWNEFKLSHPEESRFTKLMDAYKSTFANLSKKLDLAPESETKKELSSSLNKAISEAPLWGSLVEAERNWKTNPDMSENIYIYSINKYPYDSRLLGIYGNFLYKYRKNYDKAEEYFKKSLEIKPNDSIILRAYADFLSYARKDYDLAEICFKRSFELDPSDEVTTGNYATFLNNKRKQYDKADEYYRRSMEIDPNYVINLANYGGFLLARGNKLGLDLLMKAQGIAENEKNNIVQLEIQFYLFSHKHDEESRRNSLKKIKNLMNSGTRSPDWDFSDNIKKAVEEGHPCPELLSELSKVISEENDIQSLDRFEAWSKE
ncbi:MAG: SIR2 family protein [Methanothrix sp.]|nr:SIR2 family protein [Methanothrix sp.]